MKTKKYNLAYYFHKFKNDNLENNCTRFLWKTNDVTSTKFNDI